MDAFSTLLRSHPLVFVHLATALAALALGAVLLAGPKGTGSHRVLGWSWVALMATAALTSAFLHDPRLPGSGPVSPIHGFTALVAVVLPLAVRAARQRRIGWHRRAMTRLYLGGCVVAGAFTLLPGRFLGDLLWG